MRCFLATRKRVFRIKNTQLIRLFISFQLIRYIFSYHFRVFSYCVYIKSFAPELSVSACKFYVSPFLKYHQTAFYIQAPHHTWHAILRRYTYQQIYIIRTYLSLYYFYSLPFAWFSEYFSYFNPLFCKKHFPSIFWRKYYVILAIPYRMRKLLPSLFVLFI